MACTTAQIMSDMNTKCSLFEDGTFIPFAAYPLLRLVDTIGHFASQNLGSQITASIVLEIIGLISLPFMLIEVFFKALLCAFVLLGVAIKSALDKDMENFKNLSSTTGKVLLENIELTFIIGFAAAKGIAT